MIFNLFLISVAAAGVLAVYVVFKLLKESVNAAGASTSVATGFLYASLIASILAGLFATGWYVVNGKTDAFNLFYLVGLLWVVTIILAVAEAKVIAPKRAAERKAFEAAGSLPADLPGGFALDRVHAGQGIYRSEDGTYWVDGSMTASLGTAKAMAQAAARKPAPDTEVMA